MMPPGAEKERRAGDEKERGKPGIEPAACGIVHRDLRMGNVDSVNIGGKFTLSTCPRSLGPCHEPSDQRRITTATCAAHSSTRRYLCCDRAARRRSRCAR